MEKWIEIRKGGNFMEMAKKYGIDPLIARIIRNRDIIDEKEITEYLYGGKEALHNPHLLKDVDKAAGIIAEGIAEKKAMRIIGDYDIDGVNATYILLENCVQVLCIAIPVDKFRHCNRLSLQQESAGG